MSNNNRRIKPSTSGNLSSRAKNNKKNNRNKRQSIGIFKSPGHMESCVRGCDKEVKKQMNDVLANLVESTCSVRETPGVEKQFRGVLTTVNKVTVPGGKDFRAVIAPSLGVLGEYQIIADTVKGSVNLAAHNVYSTGPGHNAYVDGHLKKPHNDSPTHCRLVPGTGCDGFQITLEGDAIIPSNKEEVAGNFYALAVEGIVPANGVSATFKFDRKIVSTDTFSVAFEYYSGGSWTQTSAAAVDNQGLQEISVSTGSFTCEYVRLTSLCSATKTDIKIVDIDFTLAMTSLDSPYETALLLSDEEGANSIRTVVGNEVEPDVAIIGATTWIKWVSGDLTQQFSLWCALQQHLVPVTELTPSYINKQSRKFGTNGFSSIFCTHCPKDMEFLLPRQGHFPSSILPESDFMALSLYVESPPDEIKFEIITTVKYVVESPLMMYSQPSVPLHPGTICLVQNMIRAYPWLQENDNHIDTARNWLLSLNKLMTVGVESVKIGATLAHAVKDQVIGLL